MNVNFDFNSTKLTGTTKNVCAELEAYSARMRQLGRVPVFRVRRKDYADMWKFAERNIRPTDTLDKIMLNGQEVLRYDGE